MIKKEPGRDPDKVRVTFELPGSLWAGEVCLVGEFNEWNRTSYPLRQERDGVWRVTLELPRGRRYQFRYLIDGTRWQNDPEADDHVLNEFGSYNSVVSTEEVGEGK
ncbi:MAG: isoamylase early set domain-containing protein [Anaerolineae bacterium]|nr:isoamylase early set domain-containing protein [Anaerolineae bacterium]